MGARAIRTGSTGAASGRACGGSGITNRIYCLWGAAGSVSARRADPARESERGDSWHALRIGNGAVFVERDAGSFHLVGRPRHLRNVCCGIRGQRYVADLTEGLTRALNKVLNKALNKV